MFWKKPYEGGLVRWGPALHDRFMLPHFVSVTSLMCSACSVLPAMDLKKSGLRPTWNSAFRRLDPFPQTE